MSLDFQLIAEVEWGCDPCIFHANITHNVTPIAIAAGVYPHLWFPDDLEISSARELIRPLCDALKLLGDEPELFAKLNPVNGCGSVQSFTTFVEKVFCACCKNPDAKIKIWK